MQYRTNIYNRETRADVSKLCPELGIGEVEMLCDSYQMLRGDSEFVPTQHVISLVHAAFLGNSQCIQSPFMEYVRDVVGDYNIFIPNRTIWTTGSKSNPQRGVYVVDDSKPHERIISDLHLPNSPEAKEEVLSDLENRLVGGTTFKDVRISPDKRVRFVPEYTYLGESQHTFCWQKNAQNTCGFEGYVLDLSMISFEDNGLAIASFLPEGAQKMGMVKRAIGSKTYDYSKKTQMHSRRAREIAVPMEVAEGYFFSLGFDQRAVPPGEMRYGISRLMCSRDFQDRLTGMVLDCNTLPSTKSFAFKIATQKVDE